MGRPVPGPTHTYKTQNQMRGQDLSHVGKEGSGHFLKDQKGRKRKQGEGFGQRIKVHVQEFPLAHNGVGGVSAAPRCRLHSCPCTAGERSQCCLSCGSELQLGSDPWPVTSMCHGAAKKGKKKNCISLCQWLSFEKKGVQTWPFSMAPSLRNRPGYREDFLPE